MNQSTHISEDDEAKMLPGFPASSLPKRPPLGIPTILVFSQRPAARCVLADAMEPDEGFESLGSIAVRLVANFRRPKMLLPRDQEG